MCFTIESRPRVAEANIPCFKVVRKTKFSFLGTYVSQYKEKLYTVLNFFFCKKVNIREEAYNAIEEGYHSYITYKDWMQGPRQKVLKFYIPKGTLYYTNTTTNEYVSEKIKRSL